MRFAFTPNRSCHHVDNVACALMYPNYTLTGVSSGRSQCVAVDPSEEILAAGDASGRILIWRGLSGAVHRSAVGEPIGDVPCSTVHWHAHPVGALAFSPDSHYLLSGGQEHVLVSPTPKDCL